MSDSKYSAILMRDGGDVLRFRMSPAWLKAAIGGIAVLVVFAALGLYAGYAFFQNWQETKALEADNRSLQAKLVETQIQLERLQNVERILEANSPETLQAVLSAPSAPVAPPLAEPAPPADVDLSDLFRSVDTGRVRVDKVRLSREGQNLALSFDLGNAGDGTVSGVVGIALLDNRGRFVEVSAPPADLDYAIQRFKRVTTSFALPTGRELGDFYALRLVVRDSAGAEIFVHAYILAEVLS